MLLRHNLKQPCHFGAVVIFTSYLREHTVLPYELCKCSCYHSIGYMLSQGRSSILSYVILSEAKDLDFVLRLPSFPKTEAQRKRVSFCEEEQRSGRRPEPAKA